MKFVGRTFSLATTLKVCFQVLKIVKKNKDYIYLIDFEIEKNYIEHGEHIPYREDLYIKGNRDFISINIHSGKEISRGDDIESLGYNLIYFTKGELPWSNISDSYMILEKKGIRI